jgi:shikimate kinase
MRTPPESGKQATQAPIVALTGFMAAGKSTVGRVLASLLHWRFLDLDCEIECRSGMHVHEIFSTEGEPRFRAIEAEALQHVLGLAHTPTVIALGGGTFVQPQNANLLFRHRAQVVFLELDIDELLQRCRCARARSPQNPRPLADDAEAFCTLYAQRLPFYRKANLTVHTGQKSAEEVARQITAALHLTAAGHQNR